MTIDAYEVFELSEKSWRIEDSISRAFLFEGEKTALLVDTANGSGNLKKVVDVLVGKKPVMLINTHADADHIGCNHLFEQAYMHPSEFAYYALKGKKGDALPIPVTDGEEIDLGGRSFTVIHAPGHTCGSILLLDRKNRILIGGDTILSRVYVFGAFRNLRALIASLDRLVEEYWEAFDVVYGSHRDYCIPKDFVLKELACARAHLEGQLPGVDPGRIPLEAPEYRPALMYEMDGAALFDYAERISDI